MKRLVLFVSIFGVGLLVLVLVLGPDRLWNRTKTQTIRSENLPASPGALPFSEQGQGRKIGIDLRGAFTLPIGWKAVPQADGSSLKVKVAQLKGSNSEPYAGGIHLEKPVLEAFPGKVDGEPPNRRVTAAAGELETIGDLRTLTENFQARRDLRALTLGPDVRIESFDDAGSVAMTIETARVEVPPSPDAPASESDPESIFPRLVGPEPVHVFGADPPFDLHAAGFTMYRFDGRLELTGPIDLVSGGMHVTSSGGATYLRRVDPAAPKTGSDRARASGVDQGAESIGPGTLTFERDVVVRQKDEKSGDERWMKTDVVVLELVSASAPAGADAATLANVSKRLKVGRVDAGSRDGQVEFGLLGGEGVARHMTSGADDSITLEGPLHVDHLAVGEGADARSISLRAAERLELTPGAKAEGAPTRWRAVLTGAAHATSSSTMALAAEAGPMDADADTIVAELLARDAAPKENGAAPSAAKEGGAAPGFDLDSLELDGHALVDLHGRGKARARKIELVSGGQRAHLEGDAEVETERGTLCGPAIDLDMPSPAAKDAPLHVIVPVLAKSEMALPPGMEWFGAGGTAPDKTEHRLVLEPLPATKLEIRGDELHLRGRTCVHVLELADAPGGGAAASPPKEIVRLTANSIDVWPDKSGAKEPAKGGASREPPQIEAEGDVDAYDFRNDLDPEGPGPHLHLLATHARTELKPVVRGGQGAMHRHLLLDGVPGTPAVGTLPVALTETPAEPAKDAPAKAVLTLAAAHLDFDLVSQRIVADDRAQRVVAQIPETLVAPVLPPGFGEFHDAKGAPKVATDAAALAALQPLVFQAEHVEITPPGPDDPPPAGRAPALLSGLPATSPFARALITGNGRVRADRPSDRSSFDAQSLRFDLARGLARIAGSADQPVVLERKRADLPDAIDRVVTEWIDVSQTREGRPRVQLQARKDQPVVVLYPSRPNSDGTPPRRLRVELRCSDPPELVDQHLLLTGGVDTWIVDEDVVAATPPGAPHAAEAGRAHIRSERVELILSRPIGEGALGEPGPSPVRLGAQGRVHLDYGEYHAQGALLTYEFSGSELVLKQGTERCQMLAADANGTWHATADFQRLTLSPVEALLRPKGDPNGVVRARFEDFRLLLGAPNGN
jgi:hypothetical protein